MKHTSYIELDQRALKKNIQFLKKRLGSNVKFTSVIKGNAYGHGITEFLPLAENCGVDYFAVSDTYEAELAYNVKKKDTSLMIMNMIDSDEMEWVVNNNISFFVFNEERLDYAIKTAKLLKRKASIHIELETGLNRTGFDENNLPHLIDTLKKERKYINIEGICTHYAGAESIANFLRIENQKKKFQLLIKLLKRHNIKANYYHSACSAAALTYPDTIMDMARIGIAQYGFWPSRETRMYNLLSDNTTFTKDPLHRIISWKSRVIAFKSINKGDFISYGNSYMAQNNMTTAIIPVGYSHGYSRSLSNLGHVLIKGKKANVVGMVNMNMIIVDVTEIHEIKKNDVVVLIGNQGKHTISVSSFSEMSNYVNYEMLTRLPSFIPRYIV